MAVALLWLLFAQAVPAINRTSLTIDEGLHITSGYSILRTGDYRLIEEHPPLVKFVAAWPLLLLPDLPDPAGLPGWELEVAITDSLRLVQVTRELIYDYQPLDRLVFAARLPVALLALLLGAMAFRWASDWFGPPGGLLTLFLLTFDPNILAHASVAATDLGAACFILLALFTFQRFLRRPTLGRWALAGLALGLAQGTKLSAMMLLPTQGLLILAHGIWGVKNSRVLRLGLAYAGMVALAALVLWALYGFQIGPVPELGLSLPAASHAIPWMRLREHMQGGHAAFLWGQVSHRGWWYYFPVALALKTPLPILLSWLMALVALMSSSAPPRLRGGGATEGTRGRAQWRDELALLLFPVLYLGLSLQSSLNIGYRHLLPILPLLAISAGRLAKYVRGRYQGFVAAGLGVWLVMSTLSLYPHYLAYFNELAGGPAGGYRYLVDSNTDWGQALKELARYQEEHDVETVYLSMFTFLDPAIYGVRYQPLTPMYGDTPPVFPSRFNPPPGNYVISTTTLQGIPLADPEMYDWFRHREPDARIGHVMFLYRVPEPSVPFSWVAQCLSPVAPLPPAVIAEGFGRPHLRRAYFDCPQGWLIPDGGQAAGWYVFFRDTARGGDAFIRTHLEPARLIFEQTRSGALPPFAVYEATVLPVAPAHPAATAVQVGDLTFLGHTVLDRPDDHAIEVWTFWRVGALPAKPLSLMLHLVGPGGSPVVVADGLAVPVENWQLNDVIIQRHRLEIPPEALAGDYALYSGAYWIDSLQRWPVFQEGQAVGDRLFLSTLTIQAAPIERR